MNPEETTNGNGIRTPDNVNTAVGDSTRLLPAPSGTDQRSLDSADLGASKPIAEPKPTRKQIGEWRAANFTVKQGTVLACGHKFDPRTMPKKANCWDCWEATFSTSPEGVAQVHQMLLDGGTQAVISMYGSKFTRMFGRFLRKKLLTEYASKQVQAASGIEGSIMSIAEEKEANLGIR